jgi:hypothetical protein
MDCLGCIYLVCLFPNFGPFRSMMRLVAAVMHPDADLAVAAVEHLSGQA